MGYRLLTYMQENLTDEIKKDIIKLLSTAWKEFFTEKSYLTWQNHGSTHVASLVIRSGDVVASHVAVLGKLIDHCGEEYHVLGLSEVATHPDYRRQGVATKLIKAAYDYIEKYQVDCSIFTCSPLLTGLYQHSGWASCDSICLVGGNDASPFRGDSIGVVTIIKLISHKAKMHQCEIFNSDIRLQLLEGEMW